MAEVQGSTMPLKISQASLENPLPSEAPRMSNAGLYSAPLSTSVGRDERPVQSKAKTLVVFASLFVSHCQLCGGFRVVY